jgi:hypothetical protein
MMRYVDVHVYLHRQFLYRSRFHFDWRRPLKAIVLFAVAGGSGQDRLEQNRLLSLVAQGKDVLFLDQDRVQV